jgi:small subunit ribosomal protein S2
MTAIVSITMRQMLEAGVHFGHQKRFWNPKMAPYIFGIRQQIHIINLEQTLPLYRDSLTFIQKSVSSRGKILFVGTKPAAQEIIREEAARCNMPYVDRRWLGGMLTNYKTIRQSIKRLKDLEVMRDSGTLEQLSKKEGLMLLRELKKLEASLGGIKDMGGLPDALFIIDVGHEKTAVAEARRLGIPVIGIVDTNNNPEKIDYVIPGNDDSVRSIRLYCQGVADVILETKQNLAEEMLAQRALKELATEEVNADPEAAIKRKVVVKKSAGSKKDAEGSSVKGEASGEAAVASDDAENVAAKKTAPANPKTPENKVNPPVRNNHGKDVAKPAVKNSPPANKPSEK